MLVKNHGDAVAYARGGGVWGQNLFHWRLEKNENLSFWNDPLFFHTELAKSAITFFYAIQLAYVILRNFYCDAIIPVVKLFWCVALEPMTDSKANLHKVNGDGAVVWWHKAIVLNGRGWTLWTRQRFSTEGILGREWLQRRQIIRLQCHNFELIKPASWRS